MHSFIIQIAVCMKSTLPTVPECALQTTLLKPESHYCTTENDSKTIGQHWHAAVPAVCELIKKYFNFFINY